MPIHDWTRLEPGDFHHFHQRWVSAIADALNGGLLPPEYMALVEQVTGRPIPDVVALDARSAKDDSGGVAVTDAPPAARTIARLEKVAYAKKKNRVVIRHGRGRVVAVVEIVSPGNKDSRNAIRTFVEKAIDMLNQGVNLLVVDLFPPTPRDPQGIHKAIWDEFGEEPFDFLPKSPTRSPLTSVATCRSPMWIRSASATRCLRLRSSSPRLVTFPPRWRRPISRRGPSFRGCSKTSSIRGPDGRLTRRDR